MRQIRNTILLLFAIVSVATVTNGQELLKDKATLKKAQYVAALAQRDLSLTKEQVVFLEDAFYDRYFTGDSLIKGIVDPVKVSEIKKKVHKEFSEKLYKHYGKEKSAEIIAWYYNYSNKKR